MKTGNQEALVGRWSGTETLYVVRPEPYTDNCVSPPQLSDLVALVHGKLTKLGCTIMSALIVMEVHARDVVTKVLEEGVRNVNDFEWISQLR